MQICSKCGATNIGTSYCPLCEPEKVPQPTLRIVGIKNALETNVYERQIWNEAVEKVAEMAENRYGNYGMIANEIRKLKKEN